MYFVNSALRSTIEKMQWALNDVTPADSMYLESLCVTAVLDTTRETPYQYLLRRRIERAQTLLTEGKLSETDIASAVGFKDSTQFIRAFRKKVGVTPGTYREST